MLEIYKNAITPTLIIKKRSYTQHDSKADNTLRICQRLLFIAQHISQLLKNARTETQVESLKISAMNK